MFYLVNSSVLLFSYAVVNECTPNPIHAVDQLLINPQHMSAAVTAVFDLKAVVP